MEMKRIFCMLLSIMMLFTLVIPISVFAEDYELFEEELVYGDNNLEYWEEDPYYEEELEIYEENDGYQEDLFDYYIEQDDQGTFIDDSLIDAFEEDQVFENDQMFEENILDESANEEQSSQEELSFFLSDTDVFDNSAKTVTAAADKEEATLGETVTITATATNMTDPVSYQWQKSSDGSTWKNMGNKTDTLSFEASLSYLKLYYRCAATDSTGTYYSNTVHVMQKADPEVTAAADKEEATLGETVTITATATNVTDPVSYQWQKSSDGESWSKTGLTGNKTATITFSATEALLKLYYRCAVTDANGTWYSNPVHISLTVSTIEVEGVVYEKIDDTTCRILTCNSTASELIIPETVEGMTVIEVGAEAFMGNENLVSINLPDTIMYIRTAAFKNCINLREMK